MKHKFRLLAIAVAALLAVGPAPTGGQALGTLFDASRANVAPSTENASTARAEVRKRKRYKSRRSARRETRRQARAERRAKARPAPQVEAEQPEAGIWPPLTEFEVRWSPASALPPAGDVRSILKW